MLRIIWFKFSIDNTKNPTKCKFFILHYILQSIFNEQFPITHFFYIRLIEVVKLYIAYFHHFIVNRTLNRMRNFLDNSGYFSSQKFKVLRRSLGGLVRKIGRDDMKNNLIFNRLCWENINREWTNLVSVHVRTKISRWILRILQLKLSRTWTLPTFHCQRLLVGMASTSNGIDMSFKQQVSSMIGLKTLWSKIRKIKKNL